MSMAKELHIAITAEKLDFGLFQLSNTQFTSFLVTGLLILFLVYANSQFKQTNKPSRLQNFLEMVVDALTNLVEGIAGHGAKAVVFTPIISAFFIFILLNNWIEHIPGFHTIKFTGKPGIELVNVPSHLKASPAFASTVAAVEETVHEDIAVTDEAREGEIHTTSEAATDEHQEEESHLGVALLRGANADLNMTLALALISVGLTQYFGLRYAGLGYLKKFFNFSSPINVFIGLLELIGEFSKIISFSFRLFGNIFAGEVLIAVIGFLVPAILPIPFIGFELFVGGLQAYVFAMLSLVFFSMAADEHAHH